MASIKEAVENAVAFARETLGPERTAFIRLEEIESARVAGEESWLVTLSMLGPDEPLSLPSTLTGKREYKSFTVRKSDGQVTSMKIRELADA